MSKIPFTCNACGRTGFAPESAAGKISPCPACGAAMEVDDPFDLSGLHRVASEEEGEDSVERLRERVVESRKKKEGKDKSTKKRSWLPIGVAVAGALSLIGFATGTDVGIYVGTLSAMSILVMFFLLFAAQRDVEIENIEKNADPTPHYYESPQSIKEALWKRDMESIGEMDAEESARETNRLLMETNRKLDGIYGRLAWVVLFIIVVMVVAIINGCTEAVVPTRYPY